MTSISHYANLPLDATPRQRRGAGVPVSTLQTFAPGDVFVGATLLNSTTDDHAGLGRILQFDADLNEKGVLWVEGTTHLVYGLTLAVYSLPIRQGLILYARQTLSGFIYAAARPLRMSERGCCELVDDLCVGLPTSLEALLSGAGRSGSPSA